MRIQRRPPTTPRLVSKQVQHPQQSPLSSLLFLWTLEFEDVFLLDLSFCPLCLRLSRLYLWSISRLCSFLVKDFFVCKYSGDTSTELCIRLFLGTVLASDVDKIHNAPPIKIQINPSKTPARINQYLISKGVLQDIKPIIEDYKAQGLITPYASPCNTPILPVRKPNSWGGDLSRTSKQ